MSQPSSSSSSSSAPASSSAHSNSHSFPLRWSLVPVTAALLPSIHALEVLNYPSDEACSLTNFQYRLNNASPYFRAAVSETTGELLGYVAGTCTSDTKLHHESMFTHIPAPQGRYLCIHSVSIVPLLKKQGFGRAMLMEYIKAVRHDPELAHLYGILIICKSHLVNFYSSVGFDMVGPSDTVWGQEKWMEMKIDFGRSEEKKGQSQSPIPIWLDCDPGHDDALAMILCAFNPKLRLLGLSTVAGNQTIEKTTLNARNVLNICNLHEVKVYQGRQDPLKRPGIVCAEIHGESGLGGPVFPELPESMRNIKDTKKAYEAIAECVKSSSEPITLIATGPLTNIALFILAYPELTKSSFVKQICLMGGAIGIGNTSSAAEFNIQVDAEAASIVFNNPGQIPVIMVPLEVTHTALVTPDVLNRVLNAGRHGGVTHFNALIGDLLSFFRDAYAEHFGFKEGAPLHDPCAVAYLIDPTMFETKLCHVEIECESERCYGRTLCDIYGHLSGQNNDKRKNAIVCMKMDVEKFWNMMIEALDKASQQSSLKQLVDYGKHREQLAAMATAATAVPTATTATALVTDANPATKLDAPAKLVDQQ